MVVKRHFSASLCLFVVILKTSPFGYFPNTPGARKMIFHMVLNYLINNITFLIVAFKTMIKCKTSFMKEE